MHPCVQDGHPPPSQSAKTRLPSGSNHQCPPNSRQCHKGQAGRGHDRTRGQSTRCLLTSPEGLGLYYIIISNDIATSRTGVICGICTVVAIPPEQGSIKAPSMGPDVCCRTSGFFTRALMDYIHHIHITVAILIIRGKVKSSTICRCYSFINEISGPPVITTCIILSIVVMAIGCCIPSHNTTWAC